MIIVFTYKTESNHGNKKHVHTKHIVTIATFFSKINVIKNALGKIMYPDDNFGLRGAQIEKVVAILLKCYIKTVSSLLFQYIQRKKMRTKN